MPQSNTPQSNTPQSNTKNRLRETAHDVSESSRELVEEHPMSMALAAFGLGLGVGVALTFLLGDHSRQRDAHLANRLGRRVLDAMSHALPDSLARLGR